MAQQKETKQALNPALLAIGSRPDVMAWRQMVGTFRAIDNPSRLVKVGYAGMSDAMAVVRVTITPDMVGKQVGIALALEAKTAKGKQRDAQKLWQVAFENRGGIYRIIRSANDAVSAVNDVQIGKW
jgi:hypothetical protein